MEKFLVSTPLAGEYLTTVRLMTGGLCALVGFDVDTAEDFKVCVTESLLILKRNGYRLAELAFCVGETLAFSVCGRDKTGEAEDGLENEISHALLQALVGKVDFEKDASGCVERIAFEG